jgi:hypothetical protein
MSRIALLLFIIITATACNLTSEAPTRTPRPTESVPPTTAASAVTPSSSAPNIQPIANLGVTNASVPTVAGTNVPLTGSLCDVYTTYSGRDPNNRLSLRAEPSPSGAQIFRVPTNTQVLLVAGSQEIEAEGYHWLNVIYVESAQRRYQGWMARDSYSVGGVRDPNIATLVAAGTQASC